MLEQLSRWLEHRGVDVREALRGLRVGRSTSALAFVILTLTMAAATITYSVVDAVVLEPLPYGSPDRLVGIGNPGDPPALWSLASPQDYFLWSEGSRTLESVGAARPTTALQLDEGGISETLAASSVTANLFGVLGVQPAAGRLFGFEYGRPGGPTGVILSHSLWARRFGADPRVVGRQLKFGDDVYEVVGVLPAGVWYPITAGPSPDIYLPYVATSADRSNNRSRSFFVVGRLRRGVSVGQAKADVQRISGSAVALMPLADQVVGDAKTSMMLVLVAVGFVVLVACANVGNLLLARAATRTRELATREALGASRRRLAVSLLLEGLCLALASAATALMISVVGVNFAKVSLPSGLTRVSAIAVNGRVAFASAIMAIVCGLAAAVAPAWETAHRDLASVIKGSGGPIIGGRHRRRSLGAFLVADLAFVCMLLVATALVVTSFVLVTRADLGFDRDNVMSVTYTLSLAHVPKADRPTVAATLRGDLLARAKAVSGVTDAAVAVNASGPLATGDVRYGLIIPGFGETAESDWPETNMVTADYFRVMRMQLIRGRFFQSSDRAGAPLVMIINEVAAKRFFGGRDAVGQTVMFQGATTIVGVLRRVYFNGPEGEARPAMYVPADQFSVSEARERAFGAVVVRSTSDPHKVAPALRDALRPLLTGEPSEPRFLDDAFSQMTVGRRFNAELMAAFGVIAVVIGAIGVYGTMAFLVAQQARAIGLRMAIGATRARVVRSVLLDALRLVTFGVGFGLAGALALSNTLRAFVFAIRPTDPRIYVGVSCFLAVVGLAAALAPALSAARLDPLTTLRQD